MNTIMTATTILNAMSVILLLILLALYFKNLKNVRSKLLIGLIIVTLVFFIQNVFILYYSLTMMTYYVPAVEFLVLMLSILQTLAFSIMLWITWE